MDWSKVKQPHQATSSKNNSFCRLVKTGSFLRGDKKCILNLKKCENGTVIKPAHRFITATVIAHSTYRVGGPAAVPTDTFPLTDDVHSLLTSLTLPPLL